MAALDSGSSSKKMEEREEDHQPDPYLTRTINFFSSIPTHEDLRRYYFWEARRVGGRERARLTHKKRTARLIKLWKASWFGRLEVKAPSKTTATRSWEWAPVFSIIQGHRFIFWRSETDFDSGENPVGQIYFAG